MSSIPSIETRQAGQAEIQRILQARGLRQIPGFMSIEEGATFEMIGVAKDESGEPIIRGNPGFYADIVMTALLRNGKTFPYPVRFNEKSAVSCGAVIVPVINGKIAVVKQFRFPVQRFTDEFPRGFPEVPKDGGKTVAVPGVGPIPISSFTRELYEEVIDVQPTEVQWLGRPEENSSTHLVNPDMVLVRLEVQDDLLQVKLGGREKLSIALWSAEEVRNQLGHKLNDLHTLSAWALAARHFH